MDFMKNSMIMKTIQFLKELPMKMVLDTDFTKNSILETQLYPSNI